jgi:NAD(P)H-nitrite reductase large subunit
VLLVDPDPDAPYDRPNLSKDYLAGSAPEEWMPLRPPGFLAEHGIERVLETVTAIDPEERRVTLASGAAFHYGALLLATGARPIRLPIPGSDQPHVHVLRSLADCRALIAAAASARTVVVAGASFIGLEAAAALRARGLEVTVVAPEAIPFERTLGGELGAQLQTLHEDHGVHFRLGRVLSRIGAGDVVLNDDSVLAADLGCSGGAPRAGAGGAPGWPRRRACP